jgi:hypothetical protein
MCQGMKRAERSMDYGLQVLGTQRRQAHQFHSIVFRQIRREMVSAVNSHLMPHRCQMLPYLLVVRRYAAIFRDHSPATDEGHAQSRLPRLRFVGAGKRRPRSLRLSGDESVIQRRQLLIVLFRRVLTASHFPTCAPHFLGQLRIRGEQSNRVRKMIDTSNWVQQSRFAVMNQLTP